MLGIKNYISGILLRHFTVAVACHLGVVFAKHCSWYASFFPFWDFSVQLLDICTLCLTNNREFSWESVSERILKIRLHLLKL